MMCRILVLAAVLAVATRASCQEAELKKLLGRKILEPGQTITDVQRFVEPRLPALPRTSDAVAWQAEASRLRHEVLGRVIYRGSAADWRDAEGKIDWQESIAGGPGYRLRKLRYEAVPGLWIPALLYEPEGKGKVPASLCVMGHDPKGKDVEYQQIRCINLAKRGCLVLNLEWFGFGQLAGTNYAHARMNQLDLCGSSGIAVFHRALKRGLDVLLAHERADPARVAVSGLSGGGWQTIFISALDERVTLANPVAGYSSFHTRLREFMDLGDSEQTPCDLATVADYDHLTALMAPRPLLLTFNSKDNCCFQSGHALAPLVEAAGPFYRLFDKKELLRSHVNHDPGTHNYEKDNREAFYRIVGDAFFPGDKSFSAEELPCAGEIKQRTEVAVKMPERNEDFNSLALVLAGTLPVDLGLPPAKAPAENWQEKRLAALDKLLRAQKYAARATQTEAENVGDLRVTCWRLALGQDWTVPAVVCEPGKPQRTVLVVQDEGRAAAAATVKKLASGGDRVIVVDPFYVGECKPAQRDYLFALMVQTVGQRPLGVQVSQLAAAARWAAGQWKDAPVSLHATGPRTCLSALITAGLERDAIAGVELHGSLATLKEVVEKNRGYSEMPEVFCYGLLKQFDIKQLTALVAPRPVRFVEPSERHRRELAGLREWYREAGSEFDPLR